MVTDQQVRILMSEIKRGKTIACAAAKAGMSEKTGRKYRKRGRPSSQCAVEHAWRTRLDSFATVWEEVRELLEVSPALQANTLLEELQRRYPDVFSNGQLRTLQRRVKNWRATEGPAREVFFPQQHRPADLCESDFCHLSGLRVTLAGQLFEHMLYHFVLTYSNWESGTVCFSESAESLSSGLQNALWDLGGVPRRHRTDSLSAAVRRPGDREAFTQSYQALLEHYGLRAEHTQPRRPNENGDIEQRHHRIRVRLEQALLLRGCRDFSSRQEYEQFLKEQFAQANRGRRSRLEEERALLGKLPLTRQEACERLLVRVGPSSTIRAKHNVYSVPSRLIGEQVEVRIYAEKLELWYGQRRLEEMPRLKGGYQHSQHHINYRHIIDGLVRKPGAFAQYRYQDALFPTSRFRMAYDLLCGAGEKSGAGEKGGAAIKSAGVKEYLRILEFAAKESEQRVDEALRMLLSQGAEISVAAVKALALVESEIQPATQVEIEAVDLRGYDALLTQGLSEESHA